ncbi:MAG: RagB/SusD family nutrient uptake outer membrane protein [Bacteroidales bacterium]|nr:RagB/SusD family nutrient uptake outer membrane protein [Bacteroidales bacterium]
MKLRYIILTLFCGLCLASCSEKEFLDIKPQGTQGDEMLFSAEGVDYLITSAYAAQMGPNPRQAFTHPTNNWTYGSVRADDAYKGGGGTGDVVEAHNFEIFATDATNGNVSTKWSYLYQSVKRCNVALQALAQCDEADYPSVEVRKAEVTALRCLYYFELVRFFKNIPYIDENDPEEDYATISNREYTREEILGMLVSDLEEKIIPQLPVKQTEIGRVNKYMAIALCAKIYLYKAYVQDASHNVTSVTSADLEKVVTYCDQLISSGNYGLYEDFQELDLVKNDNGKESVWAVQYSMNDGSSEGGRINWSNLLNAPLGPYGGDGFFLPSQDLINAYKTDADGLPLLDGSFQESDYDFITVEGSGATAVATNNNIDSNVDPRLDFTVGRPNVRYKTWTEAPCAITWVRDNSAYGYHCSKRFFVSPESPDIYGAWPWGASAMNWQTIRYAHVLLWKAEALVELGRQAEARPVINQIRNRAKNSAYVTAFVDEAGNTIGPDFDGLASKVLINEYPETGWTQEYARKAVRFETRLECAMEGERFFDLVRWGVAAEVMNKYLKCESDNGIGLRVAC